MAAVLALGGDGVVLGTRLLATPECGSSIEEKDAVAAAGSDASETPATIRTRLYDDSSPLPWPQVCASRLRSDTRDAGCSYLSCNFTVFVYSQAILPGLQGLSGTCMPVKMGPSFVLVPDFQF